MASTPRRRLSTSNGYAEPQSQLLQQALRERRGSTTTPQPRDTSARVRPTPPRRPSMRGAHPFQDEWMAIVEEPPLRSHSTGPARPQKRRASMSAAVSDESQRPGLLVKDTNAQIDRLQKQAFDLKLRISLQDDCMKKLTRELDESRERLEEADRLQQRFLALEDQVDSLEQALLGVRKDRDEYRLEANDLIAENSELKTAIDEAALIIDQQQRELQALTSIPKPNQRPSHERASEKRVTILDRADEQPDSDYYSAEPDTPHTVASTVESQAELVSIARSAFPPRDLNPHNATVQGSPILVPPKTPRAAERRSRPQAIRKPPAHLRRISDEAVRHREEHKQTLRDLPPNNDVGGADVTASPITSPTELTPRPSLRRTRRTQAAALASMRLQNAEQQVSRPPVALHNQRSSLVVLQPALETPAAPPTRPKDRLPGVFPSHVVDVLGRSASEPPQEDGHLPSSARWNGARPLRMLHQTGELNRPVTAGADSRLRVPGEAPLNATPSMLDDTSQYADDDTRSITPTSLGPKRGSGALPLLNPHISTRFRNSTGTMPGFFPIDELDDDPSRPRSPVPSLPDTITSTPMRKRHGSGSEYGSQYSSITTPSYPHGGMQKAWRDGSPPWNVSREVLERDFMFRN